MIQLSDDVKLRKEIPWCFFGKLRRFYGYMPAIWKASSVDSAAPSVPDHIPCYRIGIDRQEEDYMTKSVKMQCISFRKEPEQNWLVELRSSSYWNHLQLELVWPRMVFSSWIRSSCSVVNDRDLFGRFMTHWTTDIFLETSSLDASRCFGTPLPSKGQPSLASAVFFCARTVVPTSAFFVELGLIALCFMTVLGCKVLGSSPEFNERNRFEDQFLLSYTIGSLHDKTIPWDGLATSLSKTIFPSCIAITAVVGGSFLAQYLASEADPLNKEGKGKRSGLWRRLDCNPIGTGSRC